MEIGTLNFLSVIICLQWWVKLTLKHLRFIICNLMKRSNIGYLLQSLQKHEISQGICYIQTNINSFQNWFCSNKASNKNSLTTGFWGKEAWRPTPRWNTRFFFAFSKRTQLAMATLKVWRNFPISIKPKVVVAKFVGKMQKKIWYYEK